VSLANYVRDKPAVRIEASTPVPDSIIAPILWGLEEEGMPADIRVGRHGSAQRLAKQAADGSPLNVGIGIEMAKGSVALHHRDLPEEKPVTLLADHHLDVERLRRLGANAARLVKGEPLLMESGLESCSPLSHVTQPTDMF
jgi:hypothetical protein